MADRYDVIVVGGRCAGAPLATMLARRGMRVCLMDKDRFPSDTPSTHAIQPVGVQVLGRLGALDLLLEHAPPITRGRVVFDGGGYLIEDIVGIAGAPVLCVRRPVLDDVLIRTAVEAGAEVRAETRVTGLLTEGGRVVGVSTGEAWLRARLVVGADGTRSAVASLVGAEEYNRTSSGRLFIWGYYRGDPTHGEMWLGKLADWAYLVLPTDGGLTLVAACPSIDRRGEARAQREAVYDAGVRAWPELHARLEEMEREGPVRTRANMHGFFRRSAGPGWVLVGDAGHFKDPTPGQGISDALRQAESLAAAIELALSSGEESSGDAVLRQWWHWRDQDAWEMYWLADDLGAAGPAPPLRLELQRRIAADSRLIRGTVRVLNHELSPSKVYTPWFLMSTMASALRHQQGRRGAIVREALGAISVEVRHRRARRAVPT